MLLQLHWLQVKKGTQDLHIHELDQGDWPWVFVKMEFISGVLRKLSALLATNIEYSRMEDLRRPYNFFTRRRCLWSENCWKIIWYFIEISVKLEMAIFTEMSTDFQRYKNQFLTFKFEFRRYNLGHKNMILI